MKKSYKINHDYLFDQDVGSLDLVYEDELNISSEHFNFSTLFEYDNFRKFQKILNSSNRNITIIDDLTDALNPVANEYKRYLLRCICNKLENNGKTAKIVKSQKKSNNA